MIVPNAVSPLRPVIAAFYRATYQIQPEEGLEEWVRTLRQIMAAEGLQVETAADPLHLVVEKRIGVVVLPSVKDLGESTRRCIREALAVNGGPEVALLMAFVPRPRLGRVDAPLYLMRRRG